MRFRIPVALAVVMIPMAALAAKPESAVVVVPVADVWSRPLGPAEKPTDDLRETQVLYGEQVLIHESSGPWLRIEAVEQPTYRQHNRWEGYPGWVDLRNVTFLSWRSDLRVGIASANLLTKPDDTKVIEKLPLGSVIRWIRSDAGKAHWYEVGLPSGQLGWVAVEAFPNYPDGFYPVDDLRQHMLLTAMSVNKVPYLWGGMSPEGYDCSSLTHVIYRSAGERIPRDAHEQWMKAKPIKQSELKPADLIFSAKVDNPKKITHVALYAGDEMIIEAPQAGMAVRKISFKDKYGRDLQAVESGDRVGERVLYFGSFLH